MSHGAHAPHEVARTARTRAMFREWKGADAEAARAAEIAALPAVEWKGRPLRTLQCHGTSGKGPHTANVPESMLWALLTLTEWCCVYHHGDQLSPDWVRPGGQR